VACLPRHMEHWIRVMTITDFDQRISVAPMMDCSD
jgi:hypothetical protein